MRNLRLLLVICICVLTPTVARAQGGWLDWLYSMDNRFLGYSNEINVVCWDDANAPHLGCQDWFKNVTRLFRPSTISHPVLFADLRHEIDLRVGVYHTSSTQVKSTDLDTGPMRAVRLGATYYYHVPKPGWLGLELGGGGGGLRFSGDQVDPFLSWVGNLDAKFVPGSGWLSFHIELSDYSRGLKDAAPGGKGVTFANGPEGWRVSLGAGVELWRVNPSVKAK